MLATSCRLAAGPRNFVIIGEPQAAKHVLRGYGNIYAKGLVAEVSEFLFGSGFAIAEGDLWTVRVLRRVTALGTVTDKTKIKQRT